jgi:hypothetical protein
MCKVSQKNGLGLDFGRPLKMERLFRLEVCQAIGTDDVVRRHHATAGLSILECQFQLKRWRAHFAFHSRGHEAEAGGKQKQRGGFGCGGGGGSSVMVRV